MVRKKRVILGMSGGIDSSISAYILQEKGYEVIGVTFKNVGKRNKTKGSSAENKIKSKKENQRSSQIKSQTEASFLEEVNTAKNICQKLGIAHKTLNLVDEFYEVVEKDYLEGCLVGSTPSPCVVCNKNLKFKYLMEAKEKLGGDYVATGHYILVRDKNKFNTKLIKWDRGNPKDQSYMLNQLPKEWLDLLIFPLETMDKEAVREIARELGWNIYNKPDSQGLCFAKEGYKKYLQENLNPQIGNFVSETGEIIGTHEGYEYYTIGQRRGLGLVSQTKRYYVTRIRPETSEVILGDYNDLKTLKLELTNVNLFLSYESIEGLELQGRPRFSSSGNIGTLERNSRGDYVFKYREYSYQDAKGQYLVIYYDDYLIGGAEIKKVVKEW